MLEKPVTCSIVVPISERRDDLRELYLQHARVLSENGYAYEFIFVLDGPDQETLEVLKTLKKEFPSVHVFVLNRWCGEATALAVGFKKAQSSIILTLPSYFQVEPSEIPKVLEKLAEDETDLVISFRDPRIDSRFNQLQSWVFHKVVRMLTGIRFRDISCGLRAMKHAVVEEVNLYGDLHRFFPVLAYQQGFKIAEVHVRQSRHDVKRRMYGPGVYLRRLLDVLSLFFLFRFTKKPLRFFGLLGSGLFGAGTIITAYLGLFRLLGYGGIAGRPLLVLGALLMVLGVQLFSIGLLGEIIIFCYARDFREYQIKEILD